MAPVCHGRFVLHNLISSSPILTTRLDRGRWQSTEVGKWDKVVVFSDSVHQDLFRCRITRLPEKPKSVRESTVGGDVGGGKVEVGRRCEAEPMEVGRPAHF
ncbi:DNA binding [Striga asiatica]|uniref:DNA binding n=1 Tax=Striga asiatica TaxID=4170 RepID=A0A5A7PEL8_STRAF|nr:DNA binding [Striga asiatica]